MDRKHRKRALTGFGVFMLFVLAFAIFFNASFRTVQVRGNSMYPTYKNGDRVLVSSAYWLVGRPKKDDMVVVKSPDSDGFVIKRIFRIAGERVPWRYVPNDYSISEAEYVVPDGKIYLLGDNRAESEDSRTYGPVDPNQILGKVVIYP